MRRLLEISCVRLPPLKSRRKNRKVVKSFRCRRTTANTLNQAARVTLSGGTSDRLYRPRGHGERTTSTQEGLEPAMNQRRCVVAVVRRSRAPPPPPRRHHHLAVTHSFGINSTFGTTPSERSYVDDVNTAGHVSGVSCRESGGVTGTNVLTWDIRCLLFLPPTPLE